MKRLAPLFVAVGAVSFGISASIVKMAGNAGITNGPLLFWTFLSSVVLLGIVHVGRQNWLSHQHTSWRQVIAVIAAGTTSAITETLYIAALHYISVAIAAVMLMQSVWLSVLIGAVVQRKWPSRLQIISIILVLAGTVLAAELFPMTQAVSLWGLFLCFLSAVSYALTMQFTASLGNNLDPLTKTWLMCIGALVLVTVAWVPQLLSTPVTWSAVGWGALSSIFSMTLPLMCYSIFMPMLKLGVGPILSSLELPASVVFAFLLLGEGVTWLQIVGVLVIIGAVILSNVGDKAITEREMQQASNEQ